MPAVRLFHGHPRFVHAKAVLISAWTPLAYLVILPGLQSDSQPAMKKTILVLFVCFPALSTTGSAQSVADGNFDISRCVSLEDDQARLACFDAATAHMRSATRDAAESAVTDATSEDTVFSASPGPEEADESARRRFSFVRLPRLFGRDNDNNDAESSSTDERNDTASLDEQTPEAERAVTDFGRSRASVEESADGNGILHDRIAKLEERQPGQYLITLESGQVWYQTITNSYLKLRKGMDVEISLSTFGSSYHLSAKGAKGFIQVRRIE
jgi:hypothetical protein